MSKRKRRIANIFVNPKYQLRYILWVSATGLCLVFMYSLIVYHYMSENYKILVDLSPMDDSAKAQMYHELHQLLFVLGFGSLGFLIFAAILGLVFSHRTAGPLYHFKRVFAEIEAGNKNARVRLRPNDDFQDVAKSFNDMMDSLKAGPKNG